MNLNYRALSLTLAQVFLCCFAAMAQNLQVAAAANLQGVIKVLQTDFTKKTGIVIDPITGSSGNLVTQIKNGAPFDIFLSADMSFPENLYRAGLTTGKPAVYALGSLIICSVQNIDLNRWQSLLVNDQVQKIAIANTAIAPYGKAAQQALVKLKLMDQLSPKLVTGESIAQVNTYITTGVVTVGFTSLSFVKDAGQTTRLYWAAIDKKLYQPIEQGVVILKHGKEDNFKQARIFYKYLLSSSAKAIFKQYGYQTE